MSATAAAFFESSHPRPWRAYARMQLSLVAIGGLRLDRTTHEITRRGKDEVGVDVVHPGQELSTGSIVMSGRHLSNLGPR
jgi:hypothetical protein